jgi:hypothetical protein
MPAWLPWLILASIIAASAAFGAIVWLLIVGRHTVSLLLCRIDGRGWFSVALYLLCVGIFALLAWSPTLASIDLFKTLAQAIILTGFINLAASFYFGAAKTNEPLASSKAPTPPTE